MSYINYRPLWGDNQVKVVRYGVLMIYDEDISCGDRGTRLPVGARHLSDVLGGLSDGSETLSEGLPKPLPPHLRSACQATELATLP